MMTSLKRPLGIDPPNGSPVGSVGQLNKRRCTQQLTRFDLPFPSTSSTSASSPAASQTSFYSPNSQHGGSYSQGEQLSGNMYQNSPFRDSLANLAPIRDDVANLIKNEMMQQHKQQQQQQTHDSNNSHQLQRAAINDPPILSLRQAQLICEKLIKDRENKLREEYDKILISKLSEQYDTFVKYTHDHIERHYNEANSHQASYLS